MRTPAKVTEYAKEIVLLLALAAAAGAIDWWTPSLIAGHSLVLGQVVYWLALRQLGPVRALVPLVTSVIVLWIKWKQPYSALTVALEAAIVGLAWRKGRSPFRADIAYWMALGTPLTWFIYRHVLRLPSPVLEQAMFIQIANGFIAVWTAVVVQSFLPRAWSPPGRAGEELKHYIWNRYITIGVFPLLAGAILAARVYEATSLKEANDHLQATATSIEAEITQRIGKSITAISIVASHLSHHEAPDGIGHQSHMLYDVMGQDKAIVAARRIDAEGNANISIPTLRTAWKARPPFLYETKSGTHTTAIASTVGCSVGEDRRLVLALRCPIVDQQGQYRGAVEAVLAIDLLVADLLQTIEARGWRALLVDTDMKVLASSSSFLPAFTNLMGTRLARSIANNAKSPALPQRRTEDAGGYPTVYRSSVSPIPMLGWHLIVERSWSSMLKPVTYFLLATLGIGAFVAVLVAVGTGWSIRGIFTANRALHDFARQPILRVEALEAAAQLRREIPHELRTLMINLASMARELEAEQARGAKFVSELETQVDLRTRQLKEALVAAKSADRAKSVFLATISHQLRTPLTSIISTTALLHRTADSRNAIQTRALSALEKSSQSLRGLITDILDFTKLDSGALTLNYESFCPATLVSELASTMAPKAHLSGLDFHCEVTIPPEQQWLGDSARLRQILLNLIDHAIRFTRIGSVEVSASIVEAHRSLPRRLRFTIRDSGPAIPRASTQEIFQPFAQLESRTIDGTSGSGLELAISRGLAVAMGGMLEVTSDLGRGSVFELVIPELPPVPAVQA